MEKTYLMFGFFGKHLQVKCAFQWRRTNYIYILNDSKNRCVKEIVDIHSFSIPRIKKHLLVLGGICQNKKKNHLPKRFHHASICIYVYYYALLIADRLIRHGWLVTLCKQNAAALYFPQMTCLATFSTTLTGSTLADEMHTDKQHYDSSIKPTHTHLTYTNTVRMYTKMECLLCIHYPDTASMTWVKVHLNNEYNQEDNSFIQ